MDNEHEKTDDPTSNLIFRIQVCARVRRRLKRSIQEGRNPDDRLADLLEEAADELSRLKEELEFERNRNFFSFFAKKISFLRK